MPKYIVNCMRTERKETVKDVANVTTSYVLLVEAKNEAMAKAIGVAHCEQAAPKMKFCVVPTAAVYVKEVEEFLRLHAITEEDLK